MKRRYLDDVLAIERVSFADPWPPSAFLAELSHPWSNFNIMGRTKGPEIKPIVGFVIAWVLPMDFHLLNLAVDPTFRRQGLARHLLQHVLDEFSYRGGGLASLEVRASNSDAQRLYQSMGFAQVGIRRRYYRDNDEDAIVMMQKIPALTEQKEEF